MARRQSTVAVVITLLVVCSGCAGLTDGGDTTEEATTAPPVPSAEEPSSTATATPDESAVPTPERRRSTSYANATLPVDVYAVWNRTRAMFDTDLEQPEVLIEDLDERGDIAYENRGYSFVDALNISERDSDRERALGVARDSDQVVVDPNGAGPAEIERVLVHEYVHTIQFREERFSTYRLVNDTVTRSTTLHKPLREGGAVWATDRYTAEYQDADAHLQSDNVADIYENGSEVSRHANAAYHFGYRYFDERIDDLDEFATVYENPPVTTEQLIHRLGPDEEEPTGLEVAVESEDRPVEPNERLGEMYVRSALGTELEESAAAEAAAGWGDDRLVRFDGDADFVWVLEWDTAEDADEFAAAFDEFLDERTDDRADETTVERHDERTVVVTVGSESFRDAVSVDGSGADLEITLEA